MQMTRISSLVLLCLAIVASSAVAAPYHFEDFENPGWVANQTDNWQNSGGTITRVPTGTSGIASSDGVAHATLTPGNGPFTRFGGYSSSFGTGFTASLDVYLNPAWGVGSGFDYSVAANNQSGSHLRDFIWHVGVVSGQGLLVNASNNTDFTFNSFKLLNENGGNNFEVTSAGWYTFEQVFYDLAGSLAVDFNLLDSGGNLLYSVTRTNAADDIATIVGGNRYGWFTYNNVDGLAIDNTELRANLAAEVPEPASLAIWGLVSATGAAWSYRRRKAARQA